MDSFSTSTLFITLAVLLLTSAFFSASETAMMAINRYRLRHAADSGERGAMRTQALLDKTDKLLGVILLGNNLVNSASGTLSAVLAIRLFGAGEIVLFTATLLLTFLILVFSEVTPKVLGASFPERVAYPASLLLTPLLKLAYPVVWFVNLFVQGILRLLRIRQPEPGHGNSLGLEELRTIVLESSGRLPREHHRILMNLLELEDITVDDVMTPRSQIEAIDIEDDPERMRQQISTSHHTRLVVHAGSSDNLLGVLHVRRVLHALTGEELDPATLRDNLETPYFVPAGTPLFTQLRNFQSSRRRLALVVDEYGELQGLVTLEDLLEELVGEFTTQAPSDAGYLRREEDGSWLVEGSVLLRHLNRKLGLSLPLDGPKTLNGLLLEQFEDIPEAGVSLKLGDVPVEIVQTQDRAVKMARIYLAAADDVLSRNASI
ncbi:HlyC/CorC family transporter [Thiobacillus sp.]|uniref:HlyC/CorC family transporter n=1 Tax=Thiobacillus sp. TaxID=924 RepID=UPI0011D54710|nr:HlyC/CorC family transporter [Thiobacillus sp.]MBC2730407.1 HlyC/CorC family transporter [Thiobacillus sp.]MBC2739145.1 HlyC/CorC family transporter [Thiobacillus sp.]MBC2760570.1 HlyC/CorC family transporter [Thiobacillus sp.]TXH75882.1 MAG: HlyC/CorC family transporter [Thiobacillus sp.]